MSDKDLLDKSFDFAERKTKWMYENDLIKNWFNLLSWTALTAFVFVMARQSESYFLGGVGVVSFLLVFFYGWHTIFENLKLHLPADNAPNSIVLVLLLVFSISAPVGLIFYMFHAISFLVFKNA